MIIVCPSCRKKFEIDQNLIPEEGRLLQCGFCNEKWFFNKNEKEVSDIELKIKNDKDTSLNNNDLSLQETENNFDDNTDNIIKVKNNFSFSIFLSYILVSIISFIALIILIDTFKSPLYRIFPNLELILFNLFETLKDIKLFIKDLI